MAKTIPARKDVPAKDKWNLSSIYKSDEQWEEEIKKIPEFTKQVLQFKGKLAESSDSLLNALKALEKEMLVIENRGF